MPGSEIRGSFRYPLVVRWLAFATCAGIAAAIIAPVAGRFAKGAIPADPVLRARWLEPEAGDNPNKWQKLAFAYVAAKDFIRAPRAFRMSAKYYRESGDVNGAIQMERGAEKYETDARIYITRPLEPKDAARYDTKAKFEPPYGAYLGAFYMHERKLTRRYYDEVGMRRPYVADFERAVGARQAIYFHYVGWNKPFPSKWVADVKAQGAAVQIAWEPGKLDEVKDDAYVRGFARAARESGVPIFLRYASEMNGNWTPYHGDPKKYIEKWRLITQIMREDAPNVAMLWTVFETPITKIEEYYPGPEWVDWVGLNVYSVPYFNNDRKQRADWRNPADSVKFVYDLFAARHPIMIAEYAASHMSSLDMQYRGDVARTKLSQFYASLPRLFPRIKAVCWLSMNAIEFAIPGRQKNNYSLLDDPGKARRYVEMTSSDYFIKRLVLGRPPSLPRMFTQELSEGAIVRGTLRLSAWVKAYLNEPRVVWKLNDQTLKTTTQPGAYEITVDSSKLKNGANTLKVEAFDEEGRLAASKAVEVQVAN